jgi:hypothetical protein
MSMIVVAAGKGSPVTTATLALAAVWPRRSLLAECDPAGADIALRLSGPNGVPLRCDRGIVSLAAAVRADPDPALVAEHTQQLAGGLDVLVGPESPAQAGGLAVGWQPVADALAGLPDVDVLADAGRFLPAAVNEPVLRRADLLLFVVRPTLESLAHLRHALNAVGNGGFVSATVAVLVDPRRADRQLAETRDVLAAWFPNVSVAGGLADDPAGAAGLSGVWTRRLDRSPLIRSARTLAAHLDVRLADLRAQADAPVPAEAKPVSAVTGGAR